MKREVQTRVTEAAKYILRTGATVRACAEAFGVSKTTIHKYMRERLPQLGLTYQDVREARGEVSALVRQELEAFVQQRMPGIAPHVAVSDAWMPWRRLFEVGLQVTWRP